MIYSWKTSWQSSTATAASLLPTSSLAAFYNRPPLMCKFRDGC